MDSQDRSVLPPEGFYELRDDVAPLLNDFWPFDEPEWEGENGPPGIIFELGKDQRRVLITATLRNRPSPLPHRSVVWSRAIRFPTRGGRLVGS